MSPEAKDRMKVMRIPMNNFTFHSQTVLLPLLLDVNQGPLPPAKHKMLDAGNQQVVIFCIAHILRSKVTPCGIFSVSTCTS